MSAIGITGSARRPMLISAHAEYRPQDFYFARTQSPALRLAEWEGRLKPLHSWSEIALYGAGLMAVLGVFLSFA